MLHLISKRSLLLSVLASFIVVTAPLTMAQTPTLDGKVFIADAGEKGKAADEKSDVITFSEGKFHSSLCDQYGYGKGDYKATALGDAMVFDVETSSAKDGRLVWKGTVRGNQIEGTFVHYRKGGLFNSNPAPVEHWFRGAIKS